MDIKLTAVLLLALTLTLHDPVSADAFDRPLVGLNEVGKEDSRYRCVPGRTILKVREKEQQVDLNSDASDEYRRTRSRRSHMSVAAEDETCFMCVCASDGQNEHCIARPADTLNECLLIKDIMDKFESGIPFKHSRNLPYRIRRVNQESQMCVPFVSEYSDCNDDNLCSGCSKCTCTSEGEWSCRDVRECPQYSPEDALQEFGVNRVNGEFDPNTNDAEGIFDSALDMLEYEMSKKNKKIIKTSSNPQVPAPQPQQDNDVLLDQLHSMTLNDFVDSLSRSKRSVSMAKGHKKRSVDKEMEKYNHNGNLSHTSNNSIHFYNTIDELNEDTLKNSNLTGTVLAKKVDMVAPLTRRSDSFLGNGSKALHIEYSQPHTYHPITNNKIEAEQESKFDSSHENLKTVLGNYSQDTKNKVVSKIVVNELKKGSEIIGDATAPVMSNITFTPENDTLTAMAFIAGNLLNKLWNMEKDASASSMETDKLKQEKIADLLDLFKEPLNLRQETFLKNALEHLSSAIDKQKNVKNISICETFQNIDHTVDVTDDEKPKMSTVSVPCADTDKKNKGTGDKTKKATVKAITKIHNVLDLIRRFERVQSNLSELKHGPKLDFTHFNHTRNDKPYPKTTLTNDETHSLNVFGNLLEKITKLILPKRNNKKIKSAITSQNILSGNDHLKKKFKKMYNIDLTNMTVTAKDKIILDYLTHVERNPDCLLNNNNDDELENISTIEGNIFLKLTEFFKLKTFNDLLKMLEPDRTTLTRGNGTNRTIFETTTALGENKLSTNLKSGDPNKFNSTKEKLKAHFKTIIEDLIELQGTKGLNLKGHINIADALPCIYNILKLNREDTVTKKEKIIEDPVKKVADIFNEIKKEMKLAQNRRTFDNTITERPKSAIVWERLVNNLNNKTNTRRTLNAKTPKSYEQIKKMMELVEGGSSTYKQYALLVKVPPSGKLILLKALEQDVQATIHVFNDILLSLPDLIKLPKQKFAELEEFVDNTVKGFKLSEKINEKINSEEKDEETKYFSNDVQSVMFNAIKNKLKGKQVLANENLRSEEGGQLRVSRAQIIAQLIRNRVNQYMNDREHQRGATDDINYVIARRIIYYLDIGDYKLANDLFKMLFYQNENKLGQFSSDLFVNDKHFVSSTLKYSDIPLRRMAQPRKESNPSLMFEDASKMKGKYKDWINQDHLIKQLLNIKSMRM
ncbi:uncharacterized protein LOC118277665 isoform X2 [Spodoptera frugiperda]|uniref:Uncharacterized protein LOC118277665 isoform X2 n=1 Tax=Spodoptera frugiperda TaxID=7108 RepID=A0A9R0EV41_SPOFR|nr:uncharacterized protein LOC118277665 isoform X2 [Spodoptera frugiperda]